MGEGSGWLDEGRNGCCCSVFIIQPELATEVINILARERERERARLLGDTGIYFSFCWTPHYWKHYQELWRNCFHIFKKVNLMPPKNLDFCEKITIFKEIFEIRHKLFWNHLLLEISTCAWEWNSRMASIWESVCLEHCWRWGSFISNLFITISFV